MGEEISIPFAAGLPLAYLMVTIGIFQMMMGLVPIAGNAWKVNPILAIAAIVIPPVAMWWCLTHYKNAAENQWQAMFVTAMYFIGFIILILAYYDVYIHSLNIQLIDNLASR